MRRFVIPWSFLLTLVTCVTVNAQDPASRDNLWSQYRGPSHGRAETIGGPQPPLKLEWTIDLWDANNTGTPDDCILFGPTRPWELSPAGLGITWRADEDFLYAFEVGFYSSGKHFAVFDRRSGELLSKHDTGNSQPLANKHVMSIHDDPGFGQPLLFVGNFYAGQRLFGIGPTGKVSPLDVNTANMRGKISGHACEGPRWLMGAFYLNGGGAGFTDGASYSWGSHLCRWTPSEHQILLRNVSVPCVAWDQRQMVLFVRGGLTGRGPSDVFTWQEYVKVGVENGHGVIRAQRRVTDTMESTGDDLFEDPAPGGPDQRMQNRARNTVNAMALSVDGKYVYCHERTSATTQRIVRRNLQDFTVNGMIPANQLPQVTERGIFGHATVEMALGIAVDEKHFYLHMPQSLHALTLDLSRVAWEVKVPPRFLNGHSPFSMNRAVPQNNSQYAVRGPENTLAASGSSLYLTTNTTFQVHSTETGEELWQHEFTDLPRYLKKAVNPQKRDKTVFLRAKGYPGDVLIAPGAIYISTHANQSHLYCFVADDSL